MRAKCKKCGDIVEVTKPREFKSCKCGAISLDYGDGENYYRVGGNPEDFDGEIEGVPKKLDRATDIIGEENIGGENKPMEKTAETAESHERKIVPVMWGNSSDKSTCGIVLVDDGHRKRLFFGSRERYTTEGYDVRHIADWGNEITKTDLEQLLKMIGK